MEHLMLRISDDDDYAEQWSFRRIKSVHVHCSDELNYMLWVFCNIKAIQILINSQLEILILSDWYIFLYWNSNIIMMWLDWKCQSVCSSEMFHFQSNCIVLWGETVSLNFWSSVHSRKQLEHSLTCVPCHRHCQKEQCSKAGHLTVFL